MNTELHGVTSGQADDWLAIIAQYEPSPLTVFILGVVALAAVFGFVKMLRIALNEKDNHTETAIQASHVAIDVGKTIPSLTEGLSGVSTSITLLTQKVDQMSVKLDELQRVRNGR